MSGAEVCVSPFEAGQALLFDDSRYSPELDDYLSRFLQDGVVQCFTDAEPLVFPQGAWNVSMETGDMVSAHPDAVAVVGSADRTLDFRVNLYPSASLDLSQLTESLLPNQRVVVYVENADIQSPPVFRSLRHGRNVLKVPAGESVIPMIADSGRIVYVGEPVAAGEGETIAVPLLRPNERTLLVFTAASVDDYDIKALEPLLVSVHFDGEPFSRVKRPLKAARHLEVFRGVPEGKVTVTLGGESWVEDSQMSILEPQGRVSTLQRVLRSKPSPAVISVHWKLPDDLPASATPQCRSDKPPVDVDMDTAGAEEEPWATLTIARCRDSRSEQINGDCEPVESEEIGRGRNQGLKKVELTAGRYVVELRSGVLREAETIVVSSPSEVLDLKLDLEVSFIRGVVLRDDAGVEALVHLREHAVLTDENGTFAVPVSPVPEWSPIVAFPCDSDVSAGFFPEEPLTPFRSYEIQIPDNEIEVTVRDKTSREPVENVEVAVTSEGGRFGDETQYRLELPRTDEHGTTAAQVLPAGRPLKICAYGPVDGTCVEIERLGVREKRKISVDVEALDLLAGRLEGITGVDVGRIYLVQDGRVLDERPVTEDGRFEIERPSQRSSLIFVSRSHPLYVLEAPLPEEGELVLRPNYQLSVGAVSVALSGDSPVTYRPIALRIGQSVVPSQVLQRYATLRRLSVQLRPGETITFPDIVFNGPVEVMLWYSPKQSPIPLPQVPDVFALPEVRSLADRQILQSPGMLRFE